jgi:hypothetical protein
VRRNRWPASALQTSSHPAHNYLLTSQDSMKWILRSANGCAIATTGTQLGLSRLAQTPRRKLYSQNVYEYLLSCAGERFEVG